MKLTMIKNKIYGILIGLLSLTIFGSCDLGQEPPIGGTELEKMSGEWWVKIYLEGEEVLGYTLLSTYNTAANNDVDLFIDDHEVWPCKVTAKANLLNFSFSGNGLNNYYSEDIKVDILEGKILAGAATSTGGNASDSLYVRFKFSDDADHEYVYAGYKRTGFLEDEH